MHNITRGAVYMCNFGNKDGNVIGGFRPGLIVSSQVANRFSPVVLVVPISSKKPKHKLPAHIEIDRDDFSTGKIKNVSIVHCEQILSVNKSEIHSKVGKLNDLKIRQIEEALLLQLSIKM
ncbi:type II toxin-antitoxin system PemK/MazF family toxin [Anaerobacillus isosaccharinicus]|uniref:mRNA interferase n=1 Tax=Anaerobacillus isosaccharinicus TaxID=1532552 RepID=A0A1S2LKE6_9BACI|nr:type II toxin-antitoxin system PemK/MazF family toxin [Anaerobacillus isosaccharinicus]QOY34701.1 type II toxin-antitoxin system PemK/MazF family toxin [Anaerobacillus isosaccharinicus]